MTTHHLCGRGTAPFRIVPVLIWANLAWPEKKYYIEDHHHGYGHDCKDTHDWLRAPFRNGRNNNSNKGHWDRYSPSDHTPFLANVVCSLEAKHPTQVRQDSDNNIKCWIRIAAAGRRYAIFDVRQHGHQNREDKTHNPVVSPTCAAERQENVSHNFPIKNVYPEGLVLHLKIKRPLRLLRAAGLGPRPNTNPQLVYKCSRRDG